ncbi:hypothetical protein [Clostridium sp. C2-6-12]|uniref:hypothetical protein n=1 Tax=Clostridium sp. C2-6-12 TaxID=2698832 RepID=UPI00136CB8C7|nr:hypothetical protein [Clostridium sp. C2-6-12]
MKNGNSGINDNNFFEDIKDKNRNFEFEFDIDEADQYFLKGIGNIKDSDYEEIYAKGFNDGYEKAKREALDYIEKYKNGRKQKSMHSKKY